MIQIENLNLDIANKTILEQVSVSIEPNAKVAVFGESGSGKTSLLKVCIGQLTPRSGRVEIGGFELGPNHLPMIRRLAFYMPQEVRPIDEETVSEFISSFFEFKVNRHLAPDRIKMERIFGTLNLAPHLLDEQMNTLSGGERQRVGIARGLLLERKVMLLDEITSAVDEDNRNRIIDHVLSLTHTTVVAITHDPHLIQRADFGIELREGRVV